MQIDTKKFEAELQQLEPNVRIRVRLDKNMDVACSIYETDMPHHQFKVRFNPSRIRSPQTLEQHASFCRLTVTEGG